MTTALDQYVAGVSIAGLREGVFVAEVVLSNGTRVAARPSDAVPVALAAAVPIRAAAEVLEAAAVPVEHIAEGAFADPASGTAGSTEIEQQSERLRRWLEGATADDSDSDIGPEDRAAGRAELTPPDLVEHPPRPAPPRIHVGSVPRSDQRQPKLQRPGRG